MYNADDSNIMIVATRGRQLPPHSDETFDSPQLRAELARVGIDSLADITQRRIGDQRTLGPLLASYRSPPNSDYFPFVDLNAPRLRFMNRNAVELPSLLFAPVPVVELVEPAGNAAQRTRHRSTAPWRPIGAHGRPSSFVTQSSAASWSSWRNPRRSRLLPSMQLARSARMPACSAPGATLSGRSLITRRRS